MSKNSVILAQPRNQWKNSVPFPGTLPVFQIQVLVLRYSKSNYLYKAPQARIIYASIGKMVTRRVMGVGGSGTSTTARRMLKCLRYLLEGTLFVERSRYYGVGSYERDCDGGILWQKWYEEGKLRWMISGDHAAWMRTSCAPTRVAREIACKVMLLLRYYSEHYHDILVIQYRMCKCPVLVAGRSLIVASSWNALSLPPSFFLLS